jgi:hypothetical protein
VAELRISYRGIDKRLRQLRLANQRRSGAGRNDDLDLVVVLKCICRVTDLINVAMRTA